MSWTVETLNTVVDKELEALPADMRARFVHICGLIEEFGHERVGEPHVKHLAGGVWEMRMKASRGLYVKIHQKAVVVRVFIKKTRKVPRREIDLALRRAEKLLEKNK